MTRHLFDAFGIELEYMIVDAASLGVRPIADRVFEAQVGHITGDTEFDDGIGWSNELVSHVIELKTATPTPDLASLPARFGEHVGRINGLLAPMGARLMPTAMHPWMDPHRDTSLWQHESSEVYEAFNRIFDCRGHGWANLQSMHLNLPFGSDEEFGRLHAAIRLVLPILPALAASSPVMDGRVTGTLDNRLAVYRTNCARVPSVTARVVPEPVYTRGDYERDILGRIYADLAPLDPDRVLRDEFANARGAIARFGRGSIEIRVIDVQECPAADLAIAAATIGTLRALVSERWTSAAEQRAWTVEPLVDVFDACVQRADAAVIRDARYLRTLGYRGDEATAGELWAHLVESLDPAATTWCRPALDTLLRDGPLARRITDATAHEPLRDVYARLCDCLARNTLFAPR